MIKVVRIISLDFIINENIKSNFNISITRETVDYIDIIARDIYDARDILTFYSILILIF